MTIFETERLRVRQYTEDDKDNFFLLNDDEEIVRYIRPAKTKDECDLFLLEIIAACKAQPLYGRWAVEDKITGEFVGSFALIPVEGKEKMQLGYALLKNHWGKGYSTELTKKGLEYVFTKTLINPVYAYTESPNIISQKVLVKAGFKPNGNTIENDKEVVGFVLSKGEFERGSLV
jgi:ribosomal-protein-alanine N-acetyltransferase